MPGKRYSFSTTEDIEALRNACLENVPMDALALRFHCSKSALRANLRRLGFTRHDMRGGNRHWRNRGKKREIPLDDEGFPINYLGYVLKAGYNGLKHSLGEQVAVKKKT